MIILFFEDGKFVWYKLSPNLKRHVEYKFKSLKGIK